MILKSETELIPDVLIKIAKKSPALNYKAKGDRLVNFFNSSFFDKKVVPVCEKLDESAMLASDKETQEEFISGLKMKK